MWQSQVWLIGRLARPVRPLNDTFICLASRTELPVTKRKNSRSSFGFMFPMKESKYPNTLSSAEFRSMGSSMSRKTDEVVAFSAL